MLALSGKLDHFMPVQILRFLQMSASTGRLQITHGDERADLFLINGRSAFALTNGVHLRVGDVLVNGGDIRPEAVELTAAFQQDMPRFPDRQHARRDRSRRARAAACRGARSPATHRVPRAALARWRVRLPSG